MLPEDTFIYRDHPQQSIKTVDPYLFWEVHTYVYDRFHISGEKRLELDILVKNSVRTLKIIQLLKKYNLYKLMKVIKNRLFPHA